MYWWHPYLKIPTVNHYLVFLSMKAYDTLSLIASLQGEICKFSKYNLKKYEYNSVFLIKSKSQHSKSYTNGLKFNGFILRHTQPRLFSEKIFQLHRFIKSKNLQERLKRKNLKIKNSKWRSFSCIIFYAGNFWQRTGWKKVGLFVDGKKT